MPRVAIVCALAPLIINACGGHEPRETGRQSAAAARVSAPQDTSFPGTTAPGRPAAREMKLVCDFEGQAEWVLGVVAAGPYRVLASPGPGRLVVDIRHRP